MANLPSPIQYHIHTGHDLPPARPYCYLLAGNGVWKVADTRHFYASLRIAPGRVAGLCDWPDVGLLRRVPKIPAKWLHAVLDHARRARCGGGHGNRLAEQMYHFHYFPACYGWRVSVPPQTATAGRVAYRGGDEATVVLDLHSHHEMGAFFSETDNGDEQGCRFYAVIGRIWTRPEIRLRLGLFGDFIELSPLALFEDLGPFVEVEL